MATLPPIKLEMLINGTWVDLAGTPARLDGGTPQSRVLWSEDSGGAVEIVRGVGDQGAVAVGTLDCVLENNDGALTPEKSTSPYYPYLTRGRKIRFSSYFGGSWHPRFGGYVWAEPLSWANSVGTACNVTLSAIDALGMAHSPLRSVAVEATAARGPLAYWPLTDPETNEAADQSGNSQPGLAQQQWKTGGEIGWTSGAMLPTDNNGGLVLTPESDSGLYLRSSVGIDLPASWSLSVVPTPAAKDGYLCQIGTDAYSIGIWYDTSTKKFSAIETLLDSSGDPVDYVLSTTTSTWAGGMETLTVTPTTVKLGSSSTTGTRHNSDTMLGSLVSAGGAMAVESGRARMYSGELKHLALWSGAIPSGLASDTLTGPTAMFTLSTAAAAIMSWSGVPVTVTTLGTDLPVQLIKTEGVSGADLLSQYAQGSLARIFCGGDGNLVVAAWDYEPAPITAPSGDIDPDGEWGGADDNQVTGATMTWPDGSQYTAGTPGGLDLPGVLSPSAGRSVADWAVASAGGSRRFPDATFDLLSMSDSEAAALAVTDVASIFVIPGLPTQLPSSSQTGLVDAIVETYAAEVWQMAITTSPDARDQLLVIGDATRGRVGQGYLLSPFGPEAAISSARAGVEVTASLLNGSAYSGTAMQFGTFTITPVANTVTSLAVTFPTAFSSAPWVVLSPVESAVGSEVVAVSVSGVTASGFTALIRRTNATVTTIAWVAA